MIILGCEMEVPPIFGNTDIAIHHVFHPLIGRCFIWSSTAQIDVLMFVNCDVSVHHHQQILYVYVEDVIFFCHSPSLVRTQFSFLSEIDVHHWITYVCFGGSSYFHYHFCHSAMVSNNGSLQLPAAPTASTMSTTVATADDIDVHRHESQDPLRPRVDLSTGKKKRDKKL